MRVLQSAQRKTLAAGWNGSAAARGGCAPYAGTGPSPVAAGRGVGATNPNSIGGFADAVESRNAAASADRGGGQTIIKNPHKKLLGGFDLV